MRGSPWSTVTRVLSAFQVCSCLMVCFLLSVGEGQNVCANKVAVGRELSMDRVSKSTNYEPPRFQTYPQGTQGWVAVHYSATTMCPFSMRLASYLPSVLLRCQGRLGLPDHLWGSNPRLEDRRWVLCDCATVLSLYVWRVGDDFCLFLFLYSGPLTSVEKSD